MKYVEVVEECLNEAMTTYEKTYDGTYVRRSQRRHHRADVFVPIHLYGQLVQHKYGFMFLTQQVHAFKYLLFNKKLCQSKTCKNTLRSYN